MIFLIEGKDEMVEGGTGGGREDERARKTIRWLSVGERERESRSHQMRRLRLCARARRRTIKAVCSFNRHTHSSFLPSSSSSSPPPSSLHLSSLILLLFPPLPPQDRPLLHSRCPLPRPGDLSGEVSTNVANALAEVVYNFFVLIPSSLNNRCSFLAGWTW